MTDLPSWRDTATRAAIEEFVARAPEPRIAVFDNDGTLWCEKPMPIQLDFIMRRWAEMAEADEALRAKQPYKAAYEHDATWLGAAFFAEAQHPTLKRPYRECAFVPMIELLRYLEAKGFTVYIASGGDRDFMRTIAQDLYGIPPERVIGSSSRLAFQDGRLVYEKCIDFFDDGPQKPVRIWSRIGQRPALGGGNSNGDIPMLDFSTGLRLLVVHDDAEREFDYTSGAEDAIARGYTTISVKDDRKTVFA